MDCCIYNASGPKSGHVSDLVKVGTSRAGAILSKSATLERRTGNDLPRLKKIDVGGSEASINSEGLPNAGIDYYVGNKVLEGVVATGKPYLVSLSGMSLADNLEMLTRVAAAVANGAQIKAVELNLACPNIPGKPTVAYDFDQMRDILKQVTAHPEFAASELPLGVKLAPYFDVPHYDEACAIINAHADRISFVTSINTIGNALLVDGEAEMAMIAPKGGFGGLGGSLLKQVALANVRQLYTRLVPSIDIVGVGGVATGQDAFELILCGAAAVQTATTYWLEGAECFDRLAGELEGIMARKGYTSIKDFRGKLGVFDQSKVVKEPAAAAKPKATKGGNDAAFWQLSTASLMVAIAALLYREFQHMQGA